MKQNLEHKIYKRPWGTYQTLKIEKTCQIKWIEVNPKSKLSLQKHKKRSEHWVVIKGKPQVIIDKMKKKLHENDHVFIPINSVHRIENNTDKMVVIVEVQIGTYLGEDDIIRLEDIYGRA